MVKPTEQAVLIVNGERYSDWESVAVRHCIKDNPYFSFRFTCSEGMPLVKNYAKLRIRPGNVCEIELAGQPAFYGYVSTRQVFVDAHRHHIEIRGASDVMKMSVTPATTKGQEYVNKSFMEIAADQAAKSGVAFSVIGGQLPMTPIPRVSIPPDISQIEFLDQTSRKVSAGDSGIAFTSSIKGGFVVVAGPSEGTNDSLVEGVNIEEAIEVIFNPNLNSASAVSGQRPVTDNQKWGADVSHSLGTILSLAGGPAAGYAATAWTILEGAAWNPADLQNRAKNEGSWLEDDQITVTCTVYGWLMSSGKLWQMNYITPVISPMLIMTGSDRLKAKSVTYMQDEAKGTRTTIECCNAAAIGKGAIPEGK